MRKEKSLPEKLLFIKQYVTNLWEKHAAPHYFFTPHDVTHSEGILISLSKLTEGFKGLNDRESFFIKAAAWLHDIGMIPGIFENDRIELNKSLYLEFRRIHHLRSEQYILKNAESLGLSNDEAAIIGLICKYHRRREDIETIPPLHDVRLKLLSAYMRVADAIHIDMSRVDVYEDLYNQFLAEGMPMSSEFHWLRSFWIRYIEIVPEAAKIIIHFNFSDKENINELNLLIDNTVTDLMEEIDSCNNVFIKSNKMQIVEIDHKFGLKANSKLLSKLKQVISRLKINSTASSGQLANILIDTISYIIATHTGSSADKVQLIKKYLNTELLEIKNDRPCHVLINHIYTITDGCLSDTSVDDDAKLIRIKRKFNKLISMRKDNIKKIRHNSTPLFVDCAPILLFGYSSIVIQVLNTIDEHTKKHTRIYVLECKNKNQLNYKNKISYCDGLHYCNELIDSGFLDVNLVPDLLVGNLISNNMISKIIFGANTVDINGKKIGHTAGHLTIIHSAEKHNIPIYVFVDTFKFGTLVENAGETRSNDWFTGDKKLNNEIQNKGIKYYNPRSDIIPIDHVAMFFTDVGIFPPKQIPDRLNIAINEIARFAGH